MHAKNQCTITLNRSLLEVGRRSMARSQDEQNETTRKLLSQGIHMPDITNALSPTFKQLKF